MWHLKHFLRMTIERLPGRRETPATAGIRFLKQGTKGEIDRGNFEERNKDDSLLILGIRLLFLPMSTTALSPIDTSSHSP